VPLHDLQPKRPSPFSANKWRHHYNFALYPLPAGGSTLSFCHRWSTRLYAISDSQGAGAGNALAREAAHLESGIAIAIVVVVALGIIAGSLALIIPQIVNEATLFIADLPKILQDARATVEQLNREYTERIPEGIKQNIEEGLANAANILLGAVQDAFLRVAGFITNAFSLVIGLSIIPIFLFYLLKDQKSLSDGIYAPVPLAIRPHLRNVASIINQTIGSYIRGQLLLGLVVGTLVALGLFLLGVPFQVLLGIVAGITELIPVIGP
jgi:predicted PurR-regulated permease PerM